MNRWLACLVVLAGCDSLFNLDHLKNRIDAGETGDGGDAMVDAMVGDGRTVGGDGSVCIGRFIMMCPAFVADYSFNTNVEINTDTDGRCNVVTQASPNPQICVLAANTITVNAVITARGSRALAFAALSNLTVNSNGTIDVSSYGSGPLADRGPAANEGTQFGCGSTAGHQQEGNYGAGGGAAGSFGGTGGAGGLADDGITRANSNLALLSPPNTLRGGCAGALGGTSLNGNSFGFAGNSGGALYLVAGTNITINGRLMANGSGGGGGGFNTTSESAGGGGGGSGGMLVLDAPTVTAPGVVVAEGGGGGGGAYGQMPGDDGQEWTTTSPSSGALGGLGGAGLAGYGGGGSSAVSVSGADGANCNTSSGGGGGGGGGGAGFTLTYGTLSQASQFYPAPHSTP